MPWSEVVIIDESRYPVSVTAHLALSEEDFTLSEEDFTHSGSGK
jgi:hypothetical protein